MGNGLITRRGSEYDRFAPLDPYKIYAQERAQDWPKMPIPADNEIYLLFEVPVGDSSLLAFNLNTSDGNAETLVQYGNSDSQGNFIAAAVDPEKYPMAIGSTNIYQVEVFADDFTTTETADNILHVLIKISSPQSILSFQLEQHSKKPLPANYKNWNIVEIAARAPECTLFRVGSTTEGLTKLRFFSFAGSNELHNPRAMFGYCTALTAVLELDLADSGSIDTLFWMCRSLVAIPKLNTTNVTGFESIFCGCCALRTIPAFDTSKANGHTWSMFKDCQSLIALPELNLSSATDLRYLCSGCHSLVYVPPINSSNAYRLNGAFSECWSLQHIDFIDTSKALYLDVMFQNCFSLKTVGPLDFTEATSAQSYINMFSGCTSLEKITINNLSTMYFSDNFIRDCPALQRINIRYVGPAEFYGFGDMSIVNCSFTRVAIMDLVRNLPNRPAGAPPQPYVVAGNPGALDLTEADMAEIAAKNWQFVMEVAEDAK